MDKIKLNLLKVNANRHYLGIDPDPNIEWTTDKDYDKLEKEYISETGHRALDLVDWPDEKVTNNEVEESLSKISEEGDFTEEVKSVCDKLKCRYIINYKYDGSAIRAEYLDGKLIKIISTPDEETCLNVTEKFYDLFPEFVNPCIKFIRCEVVTSPDIFGQKARNKANGLVTSKYLQDEIKKYARLKAYNLEFRDGEYSFDRLISELDKLPQSKYFQVADRLSINQIPKEPITKSPKGESTLVDGVVIYTEGNKFAIKFYFNEMKDTVIKDITWNYNEKNFSYTPKFQLNPVVVDEKNVRQAASGGVPNMLKIGGIGSTVTVALAKMTVPKIIKVPNQVFGNYGNLTCECGTEMDLRKDLYGSNLRCPNKKCFKRIDSMKSRFDKSKGWEYNLNEVLGIDRFKAKLPKEVADEFNQLSDLVDIDERVDIFIKLMTSTFKLSELQKKLLDLNAYAFCQCL